MYAHIFYVVKIREGFKKKKVRNFPHFSKPTHPTRKVQKKNKKNRPNLIKNQTILIVSLLHSKLRRKRIFSWPYFGVLSHPVDLYLVSNEQPSTGKKQIYLQFEGKNCSNTSRFAC